MPPSTDARGLVRRAETLCLARGVRLTSQRRFVLEILARSAAPQSAYDILADLRRRWPGAAPPTVYRALEFLQGQGLVHRLATLQAYVACIHPDRPHGGQFLICSDCGRVEELEDAAVESSLEHAAQAAGFRPADEVVEVTGHCCHCQRRGPH